MDHSRSACGFNGKQKTNAQEENQGVDGIKEAKVKSFVKIYI